MLAAQAIETEESSNLGMITRITNQVGGLQLGELTHLDATTHGGADLARRAVRVAEVAQGTIITTPRAPLATTPRVGNKRRTSLSSLTQAETKVLIGLRRDRQLVASMQQSMAPAKIKPLLARTGNTTAASVNQQATRKQLTH